MSREVVYYLHDAGAQIEIKMARVKMTNECKSWSMVHVGTINVSSTTCVDNLDVIFSGWEGIKEQQKLLHYRYQQEWSSFPQLKVAGVEWRLPAD